MSKGGSSKILFDICLMVKMVLDACGLVGLFGGPPALVARFIGG